MQSMHFWCETNDYWLVKLKMHVEIFSIMYKQTQVTRAQGQEDANWKNLFCDSRDVQV